MYMHMNTLIVYMLIYYISILYALHCMLYIADLPGELEELEDVDEEECLQCIRSNTDIIVGTKLRLSAQIANNGLHEEEALRFVTTATFLFS